MKKTAIVIILLGLIATFSLCIITIILLSPGLELKREINKLYKDNPTDYPSLDIDNQKESDKFIDTPDNDNYTHQDPDITSVTPEKETNVREIYRPELDLLIDTLNLMQDGKVLPSDPGDQIRFSDYKQSKLKEYMQKKKEYDDALILDESILPLFKGEQAKSDIENIVKTARTEYIDFLRESDVAPELIEELDIVVFPPDKDHLWISRTDNIYKEFSFVSDLESEHYDDPRFKEAYMRFEMGSAYPATYQVHLSGLLGIEPSNEADRMKYWKDAREIGIRSVFYHEMTHVLQIAYNNMMIKKYGDKYDDLPLEEKTMMKLSDTSLFVDTDRTPFLEQDNLIISKESQAELLEQYFMVRKYNFNSKQAKIYWDNVGSGQRMDDVRRKMKIILGLITTKGIIDHDSKYTKYRAMNLKLKDMFETQASSDLKDFLVETAMYTSVNDQSYAIGYSVDYSDAQIEKILGGLKNI